MGNDSKNARVWLASILLGALALRIGIFLYISPKPLKFFTPDSFGYDQIAANILRYGVFSARSQPPLAPDLDRTPAYPALLATVYAVVGHSPEAVILLQILMAALTAVVTFVLARRSGFSNRVALPAAALFAVEPVSAMTSDLLLTETLFTLLLAAASLLLLFYWRSSQLRWLLLGAVLFGLAALTRPVSQFLPLALVPVVVAMARRAGWRRATVAALLFIAISMGITYSWALRNYQAGGVFTLSTVSDINLVYYRAREVLADVDGTSQDAALQKLQARVAQMVPPGGASAAENGALEREVALDIFRRYPTQTFAMLVKGAARIFVDPGYSTACTLLDRNSTSTECFQGQATMDEPGVLGKALSRFTQMNRLQQTILIWSTLLSAAVYLGAALGLVLMVRERKQLPALLLIVVVGYLILVSAGAEAYSRFRIPMVPFLSVLAAVGLGGVWRYLVRAGTGNLREPAGPMPGTRTASVDGIENATVSRQISFQEEALRRVERIWHSIPSLALILLPCFVATALVIPRIGESSFWYDEAWVADDVLRGAFDPVSLKTTPVGFAALVAAIVHLSAPTEFWFRLVPFALGIGAVIATYAAARTLFSTRLEPFLASCLLATNLVALGYFETLKPYSGDFLWASLIVLSASRVALRDSPTRWIVYAAAISIAPLFSFASVFVVAAASGWLLIQGLLRTKGQRLLYWLSAHAVAAVAMAAYFLAYLRFQQSGSLQSYWNSGFPPPASISAVVNWYAHQTREFLLYLFSSWYLVLTVAILVGGWMVLRRNRGGFVLLAGPIVAVMAAALVRVYPFDGTDGRVLLFTLPELLILASAGIGGVARALAGARVPALALVILAVGLVPSSEAVVYGVQNHGLPATNVEETRDLVTRDLIPSLQPGDLVYVYYGAAYAFQFYAPEFLQPDSLGAGEFRIVDRRGTRIVFGGVHRDQPSQYESELKAMLADWPPKRLWILFGHYRENEVQLLLSVAQVWGKPTLTERPAGALLYRFEP